MLIDTCGGWIRELEQQSSFVANQDCHSLLNAATSLNSDAINLANCSAHTRLISRALDGLIADPVNAPNDFVLDLLRNLLQRNTYGAFAQLAAYEWLSRCLVNFQPNIQIPAGQALAVNDLILDGRIKFGPYFDVKAFGFNGRTARKLWDMLQQQFPDEQVTVSGSWDISLMTFRQLIEDTASIVDRLRSARYFKEGPLEIHLRKREAVTVSMRQINPYRLARENAEFVFEDAHQFTRNTPFVALYVIHPWFNAGVIHNDIFGMDTILTRSLARRAFMQFSEDLTPLTAVSDKAAANVTMRDASQLLSGIFFINIWPQDADPSIKQKPPSWLYLNPRATHRLEQGSLSLFRNNFHGTYIDDFADDDY